MFLSSSKYDDASSYLLKVIFSMEIMNNPTPTKQVYSMKFRLQYSILLLFICGKLLLPARPCCVTRPPGGMVVVAIFIIFIIIIMIFVVVGDGVTTARCLLTLVSLLPPFTLWTSPTLPSAPQ